MTEERLDQVLREIREEEIPREQVAAARERVWHRLVGSASVACGELRAQLDDYAAGRLTESRRLLVGDHLSRCVECRNVLAGIRGDRKPVPMFQAKPVGWNRWIGWCAAAAVILAALYLGRGRLDSLLAPTGPRATVAALSGPLYRLPHDVLQPGNVLLEGEIIRTAAGGHAVLELADGSRVELNERTELGVHAAWSGYTILLAHGDIIVQAAKQRRGYLRVRTDDATASVKGTIFSVSRAAAGSLITVVEGAVAVSLAGSEEVLTQGQQAATSYALEQVDIQDAISWSQNAEQYYELLGEFIRIEKQMASMPGPAVRTEAKLLPYLPSGTDIYFAIPNLEDTIRQALVLIEQSALENDIVREWWSSAQGLRLRQTLTRVQLFASLLGEEVVLLLIKDPAGTNSRIPLLLAHVLPGSEPALREALDNVEGDGSKIPYSIARDLLLISDSTLHLDLLHERLGSAASSPFAAEIFDLYRRGVSWLAVIDVPALAPNSRESTPSRMLGLSNMRYLVLESRSGSGSGEVEATFSFEGARSGMASWLALPGAAGSFDYVSAEATTALSVSTRNPREALDELLSLAGSEGEFVTQLRKFEAGTGVSIGDDIASSLGTDFTFTVERPSLPMPGWVAVFEVNNPGAFDSAVARLVDVFNSQLTSENADARLTMTQEIIDGRLWTSLKSGLSSATLFWTYDRGYLIGGMDRAVAARSITVRDAGLTLTRSAEFQQRFPASSGLHNSGFFWLNPNGVLADVAQRIVSPALTRLVGSRDPFLIVFDGETERIHVASRTRLTSLLLDVLLARGTMGQ